MSKNDRPRASFETLKEQSLREDTSPYGSGLWVAWHELADSRDEAAKQFFIARLEDPRPSWRAECLSLLGFHYELDLRIVERVRQLLRKDADSRVRMTAAAVLGRRGVFPEMSLWTALNHDPDALVREASFFALVDLAGVPKGVQQRLYKQVKLREVVPGPSELERVLRDNNLSERLTALSGKPKSAE